VICRLEDTEKTLPTLALDIVIDAAVGPGNRHDLPGSATVVCLFGTPKGLGNAVCMEITVAAVLLIDLSTFPPGNAALAHASGVGKRSGQRRTGIIRSLRV